MSPPTLGAGRSGGGGGGSARGAEPVQKVVSAAVRDLHQRRYPRLQLQLPQGDVEGRGGSPKP